MSATPYMPLWVGDFLTKTISLDTRETGAYMLLLMAMWTNGGSLPEDHKKLQRIARAGREWPKVWAGIERFFTIENGVITQSRLTEEYTKATAKVEVRRQSGALGGKAKALKDKAHDVAKATVLPCQSEPYSDIEANASIDTPPPPKPKRGQSTETPEFRAFWDAYPRKKAKDKAVIAWGKAVKRAPPAVIIAAARRVENQGQYTPYPASWLNAGQWNDEPEVNHGQRGQNRTGSPLFDAAMRVAERERASGGTSDSCSEDDPGEPRMAWGAGSGVVVSLLATGRAASYG